MEMSDAKTIEKYTFDVLVSSFKYANERDILEAVLDKNKEYSTDEVDKAIAKFRKAVK